MGGIKREGEGVQNDRETHGKESEKREESEENNNVETIEREGKWGLIHEKCKNCN